MLTFLWLFDKRLFQETSRIQKYFVKFGKVPIGSLSGMKFFFSPLIRWCSFLFGSFFFLKYNFDILKKAWLKIYLYFSMSHIEIYNIIQIINNLRCTISGWTWINISFSFRYLITIVKFLRYKIKLGCLIASWKVISIRKR